MKTYFSFLSLVVVFQSSNSYLENSQVNTVMLTYGGVTYDNLTLGTASIGSLYIPHPELERFLANNPTFALNNKIKVDVTW